MAKASAKPASKTPATSKEKSKTSDKKAEIKEIKQEATKAPTSKAAAKASETAKAAPKTKAPAKDDATSETANADANVHSGGLFKKLLAIGKTKGFVSFDELNTILPPDLYSPEQIEGIVATLIESGISVRDAKGKAIEQGMATSGDCDADDDDAFIPTAEAAEEETEQQEEVVDIGRTDDPVRLYLREMGSVELLSREGEIELAKRIEQGRQMIIGSLVELPTVMRQIS